jgi:hypothetical protein
MNHDSPRADSRGNSTILIGADLLRAVAQFGGPTSLTSISQATGMSPSRTYRYLRGLCDSGLMEQVQRSGLYDLARGCFISGWPPSRGWMRRRRLWRFCEPDRKNSAGLRGDRVGIEPQARKCLRHLIGPAPSRGLFAITTGFVRVAVILDAWFRRVVGCAISRSIDVRLTIVAPKVAPTAFSFPWAAAATLKTTPKRSFMKTIKVEAVYPIAFETFDDVAEGNMAKVHAETDLAA